MTGELGTLKEPEVNWDRLDTAIALAERTGVTTAMITGKGEPTLFPHTINYVLEKLEGRFPLIELQTNGLSIGRGKFNLDILQNRVTTVGISVVSDKPNDNKRIYTPDCDYPRLQETIRALHQIGISVRLCCVLLKGFIGKWDEVDKLAWYAKQNGVEQLTLTPVNVPPGSSSDEETWKWADEHEVTESELRHIEFMLKQNSAHVATLPHGAKVFDLRGQNVCLNNCLNQEPTVHDSVRNLIFMPDGHLYTRWDKKGSILL
jgi:molybdenum cofactor biosynthesis enzyme MoaA